MSPTVRDRMNAQLVCLREGDHVDLPPRHPGALGTFDGRSPVT
jgi:hypothetical protein